MAALVLSFEFVPYDFPEIIISWISELISDMGGLLFMEIVSVGDMTFSVKIDLLCYEYLWWVLFVYFVLVFVFDGFLLSVVSLALLRIVSNQFALVAIISVSTKWIIVATADLTHLLCYNKVFSFIKDFKKFLTSKNFISILYFPPWFLSLCLYLSIYLPLSLSLSWRLWKIPYSFLNSAFGFPLCGLRPLGNTSHASDIPCNYPLLCLLNIQSISPVKKQTLFKNIKKRVSTKKLSAVIQLH